MMKHSPSPSPSSPCQLPQPGDLLEYVSTHVGIITVGTSHEAFYDYETQMKIRAGDTCLVLESLSTEQIAATTPWPNTIETKHNLRALKLLITSSSSLSSSRTKVGYFVWGSGGGVNDVFYSYFRKLL